MTRSLRVLPAALTLALACAFSNSRTFTGADAFACSQKKCTRHTSQGSSTPLITVANGSLAAFTLPTTRSRTASTESVTTCSENASCLRQ